MARGLCRKCYNVVMGRWRRITRVRAEPRSTRTEAMVEDYVFIIENYGQMSVRQASMRMGVTYKSLEHAIRRGKRKGLL